VTVLSDYQPRLNELVAELRSKYGVPGAVAGIRRAGETIVSADGVTNVRTGVAMTTDTIFLIGSITKVWTATLAVILTERGDLDLDTPVVAYLPELVLADTEVRDRVTLRDLLSHRSGLEGDHFVDYGRGADAIVAYVEACKNLRQMAPIGELFSYGNAGFIIAGRAIEKVTGQEFRHALRELVIEPMGLDHTVLTPEEAMLYRAAAGHELSNGTVDAWPTWSYPWSMAAAGTSLMCSMEDLLAFGALHLDKGVTASGTPLLSASAVAAMQEHHVGLPYPGLGSMCLSWFDYDGFGTRVLNHGGGSPGGLDYLYILPEHDLAFGFFANIDPAGRAKFFGNELRDLIFSEIIDVTPPPAATYDTDAVIDPARVVGRYVHTDATWTVDVADDGGLQITTAGIGHIAPFAPYDLGPYPLRPLSATMVELAPEGVPVGMGTKIVLLGDDRVTSLHSGYRAFARA